MDKFKCLTALSCENLNKEDTKSMKIAKKFKEELKLAKLEIDELNLRLDESYKKNEFLRNQFSCQVEKMKSLEQKLAESEAKLKSLFQFRLFC